MKSYSEAPDEMDDRVKHLLKLFYPDLLEVGIKLDLLTVAHDDEDNDKPALTHGGYPASAVIRILDIKARLKGRGDAEIVVDEKVYMDMADDQRDALLDHELFHLELKRVGRSAVVVLDECARPKLKLKKHDRQFGWFDKIAKRHGAASGEMRQARRLIVEAAQLYFPFLEITVKPGNAALPA